MKVFLLSLLRKEILQEVITVEELKTPNDKGTLYFRMLFVFTHRTP